MNAGKTLSPADLAQFTGSENWYRHWANRRVLFTDGAHYVAEHGGAFWLLDEIVFAQAEQSVASEEFQVWTLKVDLDRRTATLACDDGNGTTVLTKALDFTDFPLPEITFCFANNTIYLPSEH